MPIMRVAFALCDLQAEARVDHGRAGRTSDRRQLVELFVRCERAIAHVDAGRIVNGTANRSADATQPEFAYPFSLIGLAAERVNMPVRGFAECPSCPRPNRMPAEFAKGRLG